MLCDAGYRRRCSPPGVTRFPIEFRDWTSSGRRGEAFPTLRRLPVPPSVSGDTTSHPVQRAGRRSHTDVEGHDRVPGDPPGWTWHATVMHTTMHAVYVMT